MLENLLDNEYFQYLLKNEFDRQKMGDQIVEGVHISVGTLIEREQLIGEMRAATRLYQLTVGRREELIEYLKNREPDQIDETE